MSAFVISRIKQDCNSGAVIDISYWNEKNHSWVVARPLATRYTWSWSWEVMDKNYLRQNNEGYKVQVEAAPDTDFDFGQSVQ